MNYIIEKYINNLTINNINDFAIKNNIFLTEKEQKIFYNIIKKYYKDIINGNDEKVINYLKETLDEEKFTNVMNLYKKYKTKYQSYL